MKQHLIALDLDGTLLTNEHKITPRTQEILLQLKNKGHIVVIVTGRPFHSSYCYYQQLQLTTPLINHNGALMHTPNDPSQQILHETLDFSLTKRVLQDLERNFDLIALSAERLHEVYLQKTSPIFEKLYSFGSPKMIHGRILDHLSEAPTSLLLHTKDDETDKINAYLKEEYATHIEHRCWGMPTTIVELTKQGINKAHTLAKVAKMFQIDRQQIIAFGDQDNDLEMLQYAGTGVAMENAHPALKTIANKITGSNEEEGVAKFLEDAFSHILEEKTLSKRV